MACMWRPGPPTVPGWAPWSSVQVAGSGTVMKVNTSEDGGNLLQVQVSFK